MKGHPVRKELLVNPKLQYTLIGLFIATILYFLIIGYGVNQFILGQINKTQTMPEVHQALYELQSASIFIFGISFFIACNCLSVAIKALSA